MAGIAALTTELLFYFLACYCLYTLVKRGRMEYIILFASLFVYGIILEMTTIQLTRGYHYTDFLVMVGGIPLWIGWMWAVLIFTAMRITDLLGLPEHVKPIADAVLVASVDVAIDPVAISMGLWHWDIPGNWFGVPYANYFGWFNAVFIFSVIWRGSDYYLERMKSVISGRSRHYVHATVTVILAIFVMSISLLVYYLNLSLRIQEILLAGMYVGGWALIALYHPSFNPKNRLDYHLIIPVGVVFWFFLIFLLMVKGVGLFGVLYILIFILSMDVRLIPFYNHLFHKGGKGQK